MYQSSTAETPDEEIKRLKKELRKAEQDEDYERCIQINERVMYLMEHECLNKVKFTFSFKRKH